MSKRTVIISPFSKKLRNGKNNAKNFPYWPELLARLDPYCYIIQIGSSGENCLTRDFRTNLPLSEIKRLVKDCAFWISVDSFLPHLAHHENVPGVVLWGLSDPEVFGYPENLNIIRDRKLLRKDQFLYWEEEPFNEGVFLGAEDVFNKIKSRFLRED